MLPDKLSLSADDLSIQALMQHGQDRYYMPSQPGSDIVVHLGSFVLAGCRDEE